MGNFPKPRLRPFRRIEAAPGARTQTDWVEYRHVDDGDLSGPCPLYGLVLVLSHSRKAAVIWRRSMTQLAWQSAYIQALKRLGGIPAVNRIDIVAPTSRPSSNPAPSAPRLRLRERER